MAVKTPTFREIITDIKKGEFAPVYLLMGEEPYYLDYISKVLEETVVDKEDRDFNQNIFYGNDSDPLDVASCAKQFPVMAPRKLVVLKEAQTMLRAKTTLEKLAPYVGKPNPNTVFVLVYKGDNLSATSKLMKSATADTVVFKSPKIRDYQLPGHVKDYCAQNKIPIDEKSVQLLCDYVGNPLDKLFGAIDKLMVSKGDKSRITPKDIEDNIGVSKDFNNYELVSALSRKDYPRAVRIVKHFKSNPKQNPTVMTTGTLFTLFSNMMIGHYTSDKSDSSLMKAMGFKTPYQLKDVKMAMQAYNASQTVKALHALRDFDLKSKGVGSTQNEYDLLLELIFKIITG